MRITSYKDTLVDALRNWPTLYLNEDDVLLHLFFQIGAGERWVNGCLVTDLGDIKSKDCGDPPCSKTQGSRMA